LVRWCTTVTQSSAGIVDIAAHNLVDEGLSLNGTLVTSSAAELNYLDITTLGTGVNSKAVVPNGSGNYTWPSGGVFTYDTLNDGTTALTASILKLNQLNTNTFTSAASFESQVTFDSETDNGSSGATKTINWTTKNKQKILMSADCVFTFTAPSGPTNIILKVTQDSGTARTITWPGTIMWSGGSEPPQSTTLSSNNLYSFYYDGTNYIGSLIRDYS